MTSVGIRLRALWEEGTNCPRYTKAFSTKASFYHGGLHGDGVAIIVIATEREFR
jgi:hypothetical protein